MPPPIISTSGPCQDVHAVKGTPAGPHRLEQNTGPSALSQVPRHEAVQASPPSATVSQFCQSKIPVSKLTTGCIICVSTHALERAKRLISLLCHLQQRLEGLLVRVSL